MVVARSAHWNSAVGQAVGPLGQLLIHRVVDRFGNEMHRTIGQRKMRSARMITAKRTGELQPSAIFERVSLNVRPSEGHGQRLIGRFGRDLGGRGPVCCGIFRFANEQDVARSVANVSKPDPGIVKENAVEKKLSLLAIGRARRLAPALHA